MTGPEFIIPAQFAKTPQLVESTDAELATVLDAHNLDVFEGFGDLAAAKCAGVPVCGFMEERGGGGVGIFESVRVAFNAAEQGEVVLVSWVILCAVLV